jgi:hypothetical protein
LFFPIGERFSVPAHYGSSSWTNGLLGKLVLPNGNVLVLQPVMGPTAGPMACWTRVFFPIGERFNSPAHEGSSSWTNGMLGKLILPSWKRFNLSAHYGSNIWTNGLLVKLVLPHRSGSVFQPAMGLAAGPMVYWTSLFLPVGRRFGPPAHYGSSSWTNALLCQLVLPELGAV